MCRFRFDFALSFSFRRNSLTFFLRSFALCLCGKCNLCNCVSVRYCELYIFLVFFCRFFPRLTLFIQKRRTIYKREKITAMTKAITTMTVMVVVVVMVEKERKTKSKKRTTNRKEEKNQSETNLCLFCWSRFVLFRE